MKSTLSVVVLALAASQAMTVVPIPVKECTKTVVVLDVGTPICVSVTPGADGNIDTTTIAPVDPTVPVPTNSTAKSTASASSTPVASTTTTTNSTLHQWR
ncbi:hypothetical protein BGX27_010918 [Mortierella sp. AM989]|nr:hypothetical protein BGX27_010918 [Mortierella sp. AM989]